MRSSTLALVLASLVMAAVPAGAQQRDAKVNGGLTDGSNVRLSKDSNWNYGTYSLNGAATTGITPTGVGTTAPVCTPAWVTASVDECQQDGTQVVHQSDGCGGSRDVQQSCTPQARGRWIYHGSSAAACQTFNTNGFAVCYILLQCQDTNTGAETAQSNCPAAQRPSTPGCAVNGYGLGTCDTSKGTPFDAWTQTSFMPANCNYNGFNTLTGYYTNPAGVCNSTIW